MDDRSTEQEITEELDTTVGEIDRREKDQQKANVKPKTVDFHEALLQSDAIQKRSLYKDNAFIRPFAYSGASTTTGVQEYDLKKVGQLEDLESFVARAHERKVSLMFKQGWGWSSKRKSPAKYIKARIRQLEDVMNRPFSSVLRDIAKDVTSKSNAFLWKRRDGVVPKNASSFKLNGKTIKPITSLEVLPPELISYEKNAETGAIIGWIYKPKSTNKNVEIKIPLQDMCHVYVNRKTGFIFGTPRIIPVENDIEALRKLEQNIEMLIFLFVFPIIWYSIKDNDQSLFDIDMNNILGEAAARLSSMLNDGGVVTPPGHELKILNTNSTINYSDFIKHMKTRVYTGLGMSAVDMGEGDTSNRATADTLSRALVDSIKSDQKSISEAIEFYLIRDLLREARAIQESNAMNDVYLSFNEIDVDALIKWESHTINMFNNNMLSYEEARVRNGEEAISEKEMDGLHYNLFGQGVINQGAANTASSVTNPQNQFGGTDNKKQAFRQSLASYLRGLVEDDKIVNNERMKLFISEFDKYYQSHSLAICHGDMLDGKIAIAKEFFYNLARAGA